MSLVCFCEKKSLEEDLGYSMDSMGVRSLSVDVELSLKEMVWSSTRDERVVEDMLYLCFGTMEKMIEELFMYFV